MDPFSGLTKVLGIEFPDCLGYQTNPSSRLDGTYRVELVLYFPKAFPIAYSQPQCERLVDAVRALWARNWSACDSPSHVRPNLTTVALVFTEVPDEKQT